MRMEFIIRNAADDDIPLLANLIRSSFRDVAERFNLTPENCPTHPSNCTTEWVKSALKKGVQYYILETKNVPCGCIALERSRTDLCYLERLSVLPQFRRKGLGKTLMNHAIDEARKLCAQHIEIGIISDDTELREWYKRLGFSVKGETHFEQLPFMVTFMLKKL